MKKYVYAFTTVFIWATMAAVVKLLLADIPNLEALSVSSVFAFVFLLVVNLLTGNAKKFRTYAPKDYAVMAGLGFLGLFLYSALYYYGIGQMTSQEACILNYLWPIMLMLFSGVLLKEKITPKKAVSMLLSFLGIIVLMTGSAGEAGGSRLYGAAACITAAACYGLFSVLNKKADYDQIVAMTVIWLVTAVCAGVLGLLTETWVPVRGAQWPGMLWLGIVIDAVAYLTWALALNGAENSAGIANIAYLTPFLSVLISAAVLGETIRPAAVIALVLIVGGILLQSLPRKK